MKAFRSRIDAYYLFLLVVVVLLVDGSATIAITQAFTPLVLPQILMAFFFLTLPALLFLFLLPVRYWVTQSEVIVHSGQRRWRIPLADILRVTPHRGVGPGPALSIQRLRLDYLTPDGEAGLSVSPTDPEAFLAALAQADPELVYKDGRIVRYTSGKVIVLANFGQ